MSVTVVTRCSITAACRVRPNHRFGAGVIVRCAARGRYGETVGSPSIQNRHGRSSAARPTPTRGPGSDLGRRPAGRRCAAGSASRDAEQTSAPLCARSMPERLAEPGRARGPGRVATGAAGRPPGAGQRRRPSITSPGPQQHGRRGALRPADQVHAEVHAVGEVDVERARAGRT